MANGNKTNGRDTIYDGQRADRVVNFIHHLNHSKGKWHGEPFNLIPWQEDIIRDIFGTVNVKTGFRQYDTAYVEIPKKQGKSELGAAIALYMLCADGEYEAEVYGCATDIEQAAIIFNVAASMVEQCSALKKRIKIIDSRKRMIYLPTRSTYRVVSSDVKNKHGYNVSACIFDELHAQPNRDLWDVMTKGAGDAREQPLTLALTTAGDDENSICYELHQKAVDIQEGRKTSPGFYSKIYGLSRDDDWEDEKNWYKANPSLGYTVTIDKVRRAYADAKGNPVDEAKFKQLRLNIWGEKATAWMNLKDWDANSDKVDIQQLIGRECYGGLDLSSTLDLTALVFCFPPRNEGEKYIFLPYFFIPGDNIHNRVNKDHVPYDRWVEQGYIDATPGNVVDYRYIESKIKEIASQFVIKEIAYDRYNATNIILNLMDEGFTMIPFGQGYRDMSPPTKQIYAEVLKKNIIHNGNPVLRWNFSNVCIETDAAGNQKASKKYSREKIDGAVAAIMAYDRASKSNSGNDTSVYDERGLVVF